MQACSWHPGAPAQEGRVAHAWGPGLWGGLQGCFTHPKREGDQSGTQCLLMAREGVCK